MNYTRRFFFIAAIFLCAISLESCQRSIGYSILLWDVPEKNLQDGQIVKVYFKSNISHVYVISLPDTNENFEIPLWQLTVPQSKKKAEAAAPRYKEFQHQYAHIKIDGLPVRAEAVNTSKQVYRLHKNEVVKILYKGRGQDVIMADGSKLDGEWLCVLTAGGTEGWCFSHNLALFTTGAGGEIVSGEMVENDEEKSDAILNQVLQAKWYPESYTRMLSENLIDLESMKTGYGFDTGTESGKVSINIKDRFRSANYGGITKVSEKVYDFTGTPFQMIINSADEIIVNYTGTENKPEAYTFVTISGDYNIAALMQAEQNRRTSEMQKLYNVDSFKSANYGTLTFTGLNSFSWSGFSLIVPNIISREARGRGSVSIKYLIAENLKNNFDGILTFNFDGSKKEVNFFYKHLNNSLKLEDASEAVIKNNVAISRGKNPTVLTFEK
ncbi:MAG: SH3 domain-containing protein [Treponemataceae bacterium]|nr:SH3 domain-containing protein [Treponemataceae bacterium]